MYEPEPSKSRRDWFFCEVKGPGDDYTPEQPPKFEEIYRATGRPIRVLRFVLVTSAAIPAIQ